MLMMMVFVMLVRMRMSCGLVSMRVAVLLRRVLWLTTRRVRMLVMRIIMRMLVLMVDSLMTVRVNVLCHF